MKARVRRMLEVKSEMIHKIGFDPATPGVAERGYLVIQFAGNLKAYGYANVAYADYLQMANAPSIGAAFNLLIKDKYESELLTPNDQHVIAATELSKPPTVQFNRGAGALMTSNDVPMFDVMEDVPKPKRRK